MRGSHILKYICWPPPLHFSKLRSSMQQWKVILFSETCIFWGLRWSALIPLKQREKHRFFTFSSIISHQPISLCLFLFRLLSLSLSLQENLVFSATYSSSFEDREKLFSPIYSPRMASSSFLKRTEETLSASNIRDKHTKLIPELSLESSWVDNGRN